ncbi:ABC transporter substrate-binding protein [Rhodococcus rhodochrous]|nr:ABC transporter substrate-binding protein [Rhodococcus rhodochrous]
MTLRRALSVVSAVALATGLAACSASGTGEDTLVISASATPHVEILEHVRQSGALGDVVLDIKPVTGEVDPNELLEAGDVDANFFQHHPYLADWQQQKGVDSLESVAAVHLEPLGLYSNKIAAVADLKDGDTIALPKDTTNFARALYLLESAGLLELDKPLSEADIATVTAANIVSNPKNLRFVELERAQLARTVDDPAITASVVNSNYALEAGLNPADDSIVRESVDNNPFENILVVRSENASDPAVTALADALESPEVAAWIAENYDGAVVPVHEVGA